MGSLEAAADDELMLRYRDGDMQAFELLYARHKTALYRYLRQICRSRTAADDVFQEVWSKVIASRDRYEPRAQFKTFLFRIAHNCAVDGLRRAERQDRGQPLEEVIAVLPGAAHEQPDARALQSQLRAEFQTALAGLPPEQRDAFVLYEESGLSLDEIAAITGVSMETAKSRLRYAVAKLRVALGHHREPSMQA